MSDNGMPEVISTPVLCLEAVTFLNGEVDQLVYYCMEVTLSKFFLCNNFPTD